MGLKMGTRMAMGGARGPLKFLIRESACLVVLLHIR